jgi:hypothetical protein
MAFRLTSAERWNFSAPSQFFRGWFRRPITGFNLLSNFGLLSLASSRYLRLTIFALLQSGALYLAYPGFRKASTLGSVLLRLRRAHLSLSLLTLIGFDPSSLLAIGY